MDDLGGGHDGLGREDGGVQTLHDPLRHLFRRAVQGDDLSQGAVRVIPVLVEGGHVDAGDLCDFAQEFVLRQTGPFGCAVAVHDLHRALLALAQGEEVEKLRQRLGVVGAGPACKDDIM